MQTGFGYTANFLGLENVITLECFYGDGRSQAPKQPNERQVHEQIPKLRRIEDLGIVEGGEACHRV